LRAPLTRRHSPRLAPGLGPLSETTCWRIVDMTPDTQKVGETSSDGQSCPREIEFPRIARRVRASWSMVGVCSPRRGITTRKMVENLLYNRVVIEPSRQHGDQRGFDHDAWNQRRGGCCAERNHPNNALRRQTGKGAASLRGSGGWRGSRWASSRRHIDLEGLAGPTKNAAGERPERGTARAGSAM